jgi:hypothetical protein
MHKPPTSIFIENRLSSADYGGGLNDSIATIVQNCRDDKTIYYFIKNKRGFVLSFLRIFLLDLLKK